METDRRRVEKETAEWGETVSTTNAVAGWPAEWFVWRADGGKGNT